MIPASAVLLSDRAAESLAALEAAPAHDSSAIARRARALKPVLLVDCLHGEVVRKNSIPRSLRERYGLENLYVEDLPGLLEAPLYGCQTGLPTNCGGCRDC